MSLFFVFLFAIGTIILIAVIYKLTQRLKGAHKVKVMYQPMVYVIRTIHMAIGVFYTVAIFYIWYSVLFNAITFWTWIAIAAHVIEGVIILINHGDCPLGVFHTRYGDDKTLFELVAGKTYAKYGFKIWFSFAIIGSILVFLRFLLK